MVMPLVAGLTRARFLVALIRGLSGSRWIAGAGWVAALATMFAPVFGTKDPQQMADDFLESMQEGIDSGEIWYPPQAIVAQKGEPKIFVIDSQRDRMYYAYNVFGRKYVKAVQKGTWQRAKDRQQTARINDLSRRDGG